jgi:hypothetical protein
MSNHDFLTLAGTPVTPGKPAPSRFFPPNPITFILLAILLIQTPGLAPAQQFRKAIFPHHSTGLCLWDRSIVSDLTPPTTIPHEIAEYNSSHGYSGSDAVSMYCDVYHTTPSPMNNWEDWANVFEGTEWTSEWQDILASDYSVIVVKTGYIATQMMSYPGYSLSDYQGQWRRIISKMASRPDKFFVITTNYPAPTDGHSDRDQQSNLFADWAKNTLATGNDSFGPFPPNVYVLDWFHWLASAEDGYCDPVYGSFDEGPGGDHPSNETVAVVDPQFVREIFDAAIAYENGSLALTWGGPPSLTGILRNRVKVGWQTLSEINTYRFYVQRHGQEWQTIDSVNAGGTSLSPRNYAVIDSNVTGGTWMYRIKEVDLNGSTHYSETATTTLLAIESDPVVRAYALEQNFPNPFNPNTTIQYSLPAAVHVKLTVFNMLGEETATLVNQTRPPGTHTVRFDGSRLSSGLYFYRLEAGNYVEMKKLVLIK